MSSFFWIEFFLDRGDFRIPTFSACPPSLLPYERMCLAIPGKIVSLHDAQGVKMAKVDFGGVFREAASPPLNRAGIGRRALLVGWLLRNQVLQCIRPKTESHQSGGGGKWAQGFDLGSGRGKHTEQGHRQHD